MITAVELDKRRVRALVNDCWLEKPHEMVGRQAGSLGNFGNRDALFHSTNNKQVLDPISGKPETLQKLPGIRARSYRCIGHSGLAA